MSDWEVVSVNKKNPNNSEWEQVTEEDLSSNKRKGIKGIGHDIYETFAEPIRHPISSLVDAIAGLGSETYGLGKQALSLPFESLSGHIPRITKNIAQGFENFVNTPANVAGYLGKHGIGFPEDIAERAHIKVNPFEMGEQEAGDVFAQGLPSLAALGPLGEAGKLGTAARIAARGGSGAGIGLTQNQNPILTGLLNAAIPEIVSRTPGFTNKAIANKLSADKKMEIQRAAEGYNNFFNEAKNLGVGKINKPSINAGDIVRHSQPKHHEALIKFLNEPTLENAHWAQSDLGFLKRHLENVAKKQDLTSTQHNTLKNVIEAQNRIKKSMFNEKNMKNSPNLENKYNQLSQKYLENVVPYKELQELSEYESKNLTRNNLIKSLLNNDTFMLGLAKKYPQIYLNKALRSTPAKVAGSTILGGALGGLGFEEGRKLIK
jgi:hypothetical protein